MGPSRLMSIIPSPFLHIPQDAKVGPKILAIPNTSRCENPWEKIMFS